jgi:purine nucleosidase
LFVEKLMRALLILLVFLNTFICTDAYAAAPSAPSPAPRKVIIDQDAFGPGGTNLQSILMLLQAPSVEVLGITVVSGDGWRDENIAHLLRLLEIAGRRDIPVYAGAAQPLVNNAQRSAAWERLYGPLVYKGAWNAPSGASGPVRHSDPFFVPAQAEGMPSLKVQPESAVDFMIRTVHRFPGEVTIWAGGPLTDLALAARIDPTFAANARELVFMGGSFNPKPTPTVFADEYRDAPRREFNLRWDPEAASIVLHEPWPRITEVPVDATVETMFGSSLYESIRRGHAPFDDYLYRYRQSLPMWDELTAAVWLDPSLVTAASVSQVDVDTSFTASYGDTLSWPVGKGPGLGERPVHVVRHVDVARFERMTLELLTRKRESP